MSLRLSLLALSSLALVPALTAPAHALVAPPPAVTSSRLAADAPLPAGLKAQGKRVIGVWQYQGPGPARGFHVLSSTSRSAKGGESRQLFAQQYAVTKPGGKPAQVRLVKDAVNNCELDLVVSFVQGSVSFAYDLNGDATERPTPRKLLVLEGKAKHALRGVGRGKDFDDKPIGGDYKADAFTGEGALATWAEAQWNLLLDTNPVAVDP